VAVPHRFPALIAAPPSAPGRLWLTGARLFDGTGHQVRDGAAVLVEDGVIRRVGSASERCPDGARLLDVQQRMLMPGLTDAHVHAAGHGPRTLRGAEEVLAGTAAHFLQAELREYLRQGVTTIRVTGSQGQRPQEARQAMRYGAFRGPRLLTCGKIISATAPGGRFYGDMYREADGPDDMLRAVREQVRAGADFIKVMTTGARSNELEDPEPLQLTKAELAAVASEAHRLGFRVSAHAEGLAGCQAAIAHGADTIEHGMYLHQRPDLLEAMAASGQTLVPTLSGYYWMAGLGEAISPSGTERAPEMPPELVALADHNLEQGAASMRAARDAGVKIALGSDVSLGVALEIQRMIHHGLSPAQALVAATKTAAEALGLGVDIGTVEEGKLADLLIVDGDAVAEPELLADSDRIWMVLQLGVIVAGRALENDIQQAPATIPLPLTRMPETPDTAGAAARATITAQ
jgi:imidazolonepropionase-like amidohydrolase